MSKRDETDRPQKVATPAYLHQRLHSFRIGKADNQSYVLRDNVRGKSYDFEPWQFFLMEVLPGCNEEDKLSSVFEDRFGHPLVPRDRDLFFASLADAKLFNEAAESHPLLTRFTKKTYEVEGEKARAKSFRSLVAEESQAAAGATDATKSPPTAAPSAVRPGPSPSAPPGDDETLPAGMQGATDFDPRSSRWMLVLFNPTYLLKATTPLLWPLRYAIFALPLMLLGAVSIVTRNVYSVQEDLTRLLDGFDLFEHWAVSLLSINLAVTCLTAVLAYRYRATVSGFGIALVMRFYPRFATRISHLDQLSRIERMWLHGAPLLMRLFLFSVGIYVWFATRGSSEMIPTGALAMAMTSAVSLLLSANPLIKSNGYHLLAAFTNEPHLRGKALKALLNKLRGGGFKEANELLLATYAITMAAFMFVLVVGAAAFVGFALHQLHLGGSAIIVAAIVGFLLLRGVFNYFRKVETVYDRSVQFDRWRKRTHGEKSPEDTAAPSRGMASYIWRAVLLTLVVALFLPYSYSAGGSFVVYPRLQQVVSTDVSGRVEEVYFEGGETVAKGTVVARLASAEDQAQANVIEKKMREQEAVLQDLQSRPRPEDVRVAKMALEVEQTRVEFSRLELKRIKKLADDEIIPLEELDDAQRKLSVDLKQRAEKRAALDVAKLGPTEFEIAEAQAKLETLSAQRDVYLDRVERSELRMPFDGRILTLHLRDKGNSYYRNGEDFADVETSGTMTAEIEVPESEAEYLVLGATVELKPIAYSSEVFTGTVVHIDWDITERQFGNVIKVIAELDDDEGRLKTGMTGYAKVAGTSLLVWEAYSQQLLRFFQVHVWSWIP